jgi:hypothetical protein
MIKALYDNIRRRFYKEPKPCSPGEKHKDHDLYCSKCFARNSWLFNEKCKQALAEEIKNDPELKALSIRGTDNIQNFLKIVEELENRDKN